MIDQNTDFIISKCVPCFLGKILQESLFFLTPYMM